MEKDWFDYAIQILSALGSIGTFGAFIYLFFRDRNKEQQLAELQKIAKINQHQLDDDRTRNRLNFLPWLFIEEVRIISPQTIQYVISNRSRSIHVRKLQSSVVGYRMELRNQIFDFHTDKIEFFEFTIGTSVNKDEEYSLLHIYYRDQLGYYYDSEMIGNTKKAYVKYPRKLEKKEVEELRLNVEETDQSEEMHK